MVFERGQNINKINCSSIINVVSVPLTQCCSDDKIENNEMGRACSIYGGEERCIQGFSGET